MGRRIRHRHIHPKPDEWYHIHRPRGSGGGGGSGGGSSWFWELIGVIAFIAVCCYFYNNVRPFIVEHWIAILLVIGGCAALLRLSLWFFRKWNWARIRHLHTVSEAKAKTDSPISAVVQAALPTPAVPLTEQKTDAPISAAVQAALPTPAVSLTERAAHEVKKILEDQKLGPGTVLRVRVVDGDCNAIHYSLGLDQRYDDTTDSKFDYFGVNLVVDKKSAAHLDGMKIDFYEGLEKRGFVFDNSNAGEGNGGTVDNIKPTGAGGGLGGCKGISPKRLSARGILRNIASSYGRSAGVK